MFRYLKPSSDCQQLSSSGFHSKVSDLMLQGCSKDMTIVVGQVEDTRSRKRRYPNDWNTAHRRDNLPNSSSQEYTASPMKPPHGFSMRGRPGELCSYPFMQIDLIFSEKVSPLRYSVTKGCSNVYGQYRQTQGAFVHCAYNPCHFCVQTVLLP